MIDVNMKVSPIIRSNLECLTNHYYNSTKLASWKFNQFYYVLKDKETCSTEEEVIFKCLIYIYENFINYAFKYDVSECLKQLKFVLENNKKSRTRFRKIRILESFAKGRIIKDPELINLILEQLELLFDYVIDRMLPEMQKGIVGKIFGVKGRDWIKLDKPVRVINPLKSQLEIKSEVDT